ncbi:sigma-70 family RNA polymerase sigma factor [Bacillus toyonensis]|uniref:sigma-70 family RNA polymerase sigma factor n=1 Tax=Bacillus toyonensis TaxID=155322 RepID=UPI00027BEAA3|nr:sigma-70 family RNA polymerase sigma factor [Bacillus toyonensis]EJV41771.1 sigma-70 family RNA polymerase sigma factor [Bacillus toyonensis]
MWTVEQAEELYNEKEYLIKCAIDDQFGSCQIANHIAKKNNLELKDLFQIGRTVLWELCLKFNPDKKGFKSYVMTTLKWRLADYIHEKGTVFKVSRWTSIEERNEINVGSIDLHTSDGSVTGGFFAIDTTNVERQAIARVEFDTALSVLSTEEKLILCLKLKDMTDEEIGKVVGTSKQVVNRKKKRSFKKIRDFYENRKLEGVE